MKPNSTLRNKIWSYLTIFSFLILSFLWFFQVVFLNKYYEMVKTNDINKIAKKIASNYNNNGFEEQLEEISFNNNICVEFIFNNKDYYSTNDSSRGCLENRKNDFDLKEFKEEFINSNKNKLNYIIKSPRGDFKTIIKALKIDDNNYLFITSSLTPLTSTTNILASQLVYVTIIVLFLAFLIAYYISKKISQPIIKINEAAKKLGKGNYDIDFNPGTTIKEIDELATTLNNTQIELSKTDDLRRELLANVSHDLKTPLTMIKAYSEMVRDLSYKDKEKREKNLNIIINETDRLNLLVNDILDLSKMQTSGVTLNYETFDLNELILSILDKFNYLEETEGYKFKYDNKQSLIVNCDYKKIQQVIYNLVNNATNYVGKDKKVIINIIDNKDNIRIEITDHGKGIDYEDINLIWEKYYKVNKQYKRNIHGTGLGLSIVKSILINHNYNYGVISEKNKGTTFYFEIKKL